MLNRIENLWSVSTYARGIGRYTANLTKELQKLGLDIYVVCDEKGNGDFPRISPNNAYNSDVLLKIVEEIKPDVVHIQFEPEMYGLDPKNPRKSGTYIDSFYTRCKTSITEILRGIIVISMYFRWGEEYALNYDKEKYKEMILDA